MISFGAGAHSFAGERQRWNVKPVPAYIRRIEAERSPDHEGEAIGRRLVEVGVEDARFSAGLDETFGAGRSSGF